MREFKRYPSNLRRHKKINDYAFFEISVPFGRWYLNNLQHADVARAVVFVELQADASIYAVNTQCTCLFILKGRKI